MKAKNKTILLISVIIVFAIAGADSVWRRYQWLWYGYGRVYYQEWLTRKDIRFNEDTPYINKEKSEILRMLPVPEGDGIDTIYRNREYHFASTEEWCKDSVFNDTTDTVAVVNMLYWYNLNERKTHLAIVLKKKDDKWISCFVCHWNPKEVIF